MASKRRHLRSAHLGNGQFAFWCRPYPGRPWYLHPFALCAYTYEPQKRTHLRCVHRYGAFIACMCKFPGPVAVKLPLARRVLTGSRGRDRLEVPET